MAMRRLGARLMTQSSVHGSSNEGSISIGRAALFSHHSVAIKPTHSDTSIVSFSHHGRGLEANAPAEAPGSRSPRRAIRSNVGVTMGCAVLGSPCRAGTAHVMLFRPIGIERRNNEVTPERPDLAEEAIVVFCRRCRNW